MGFETSRTCSPSPTFSCRRSSRVSLSAGSTGARVLLATEISFASDLVGSGHDWMFTTGLSDEETLGVVRRIQRKMPKEVYAVVGIGIGTSPKRSTSG